MTTQTQEKPQISQVELDLRNKEVAKSFQKVVAGCKPLLKPFANAKYRSVIEIDHTKSGQETNLISEFLTCFFSIVLTKNRSGYVMVYFTYDAASIEQFGARLYNRALRQLFKHTMIAYAEDSVRVNVPGRVEPFFINRLTSGVKPYVQISTVTTE